MELNPFEGATNRTAVAVFIKGKAVSYPVSYQYWKKRGAGRGSAIGFDTPYEEVSAKKITFRAWYAEPVDKKDSTSSWITARKRALRALHNVLGASPYTARAGTFTGGANAVFWVEFIGERPGGASIISNITEGAKRKVQSTQAAIESELLFPLLRGANVQRWMAAPEANIILTHKKGMRLKAIPEHDMQVAFPRAFSYLKRFEPMLRKRAAFKRYFKENAPFYSIFNIGDYTFSGWKVVWREQASTFTAAVVGPRESRAVVPDHKLMMVAIDSRAEAHYLCAALNSAPSCLAVAAYTIQIQMDTHILENVAVPQFSKDKKTHLRLAELSEAAHRAAAKSQSAEVKKIEEEIDRAAARLWSLSDEDLAEIKRSLEEA